MHDARRTSGRGVVLCAHKEPSVGCEIRVHFVELEILLLSLIVDYVGTKREKKGKLMQKG